MTQDDSKLPVQVNVDPSELDDDMGIDFEAASKPWNAELPDDLLDEDEVKSSPPLEITDADIPADDFAEVLEPSDIELEEETTEAMIEEILNPGDETPDIDFMIEYLTSHELDERKRDKFFDYLKTLDGDTLQTVWQSFKATYGQSIATITATGEVQAIIKAVESSNTLRLRNQAVHTELTRIAKMQTLLSRHFRSDLSDTPLNSFRIDNISKQLAENHKNLTTLNAAILAMAELLMVGGVTPEEAANSAINIDRAVKICATVGYSAKAWNMIYEQAKADKIIDAKEIAELKERLKAAQEAIAQQQASAQAEAKRIEAMTMKASTYVIGNYSGNYITTINKPDESTIAFRVSPFNLRITQERDEALELPDIEVAREVLDAVQVWGKRNLLVKRELASKGVAPDTLFIQAESLVKVN